MLCPRIGRHIHMTYTETLMHMNTHPYTCNNHNKTAGKHENFVKLCVVEIGLGIIDKA